MESKKCDDSQTVAFCAVHSGNRKRENEENDVRKAVGLRMQEEK